MSATLLIICSLIPFYILGAFPSGYLIAKSRGVDIAAAGSGNVGATNVARSVGMLPGSLTLLLDLSKGALAVLLGGALNNHLWYQGSCAVCVVLGHCFSIPGKLKGGKGVATAFGAGLVLHTKATLFAACTFVVTLALMQIVSLASLVAVLSAPLFALLTQAPDAVFYTLMAISLIVTFRHRDNITRIIEGREERFRLSVKEQ